MNPFQSRPGRARGNDMGIESEIFLMSSESVVLAKPGAKTWELKGLYGGEDAPGLKLAKPGARTWELKETLSIRQFATVCAGKARGKDMEIERVSA